MLNNVSEPLFDGGDDPITVRVTANVVGKTFGAISADIQSGPAITTAVLPTTWDGGNLQAATCPAGAKADGVFAYDQASGQVVPLHGAGNVVPVTAGAAVTAGQEVQSDAAGKAIPAYASVQLGAGNSKIAFTAKSAGLGGNGITVQLKDPGGNNQALSVAITGTAIVVNLATDGGGAITSTVAQIIAAIAASAAASARVTAANGTGSDGTGVVVAAAATSLAGGGVPNGKAVASAANATDCFVRIYT